MIVEVRSSFQRDAKKLPAQIQHQLFNIIENLHDSSSLSEIINCKKLTGFRNAYRIRLGNYRIGFYILKFD
jgi:mRNA interferase RelE/StbE